ncbi:MAG: SWIM zinc finger domain-containing protein [Chloroflexi bacterium]|nr:SWIM zinc finger domain-containing protein [Chloroflexota bacterium]
MALPGVTEATIRQHASEESFRRGESYYAEGAVASLGRRGDALSAAVWGSQPEPYRVAIAFDQSGIVSAACDCPYTEGGWCKHIVATLLAALRQPEKVQERPPLDVLLAGLNPEQLRTILLRLVERHPDLVEGLESQIALLVVIPAGPAPAPAGAASVSVRPSAAAEPLRPRPAPLDVRTHRRAVRAAFHSADRLSSSEAYWAVSGVVGEVRAVVDQALAFVRAGDAWSGLAVLEAVTDEFKDAWETLDDSNGEIGDFFGELGNAWTEAILNADLSRAEREEWREKLEGWQADVGDYGVDDCFLAAIAAAKQGWDYPPLLRVLRGEPGAPTAGAAALEEERADGRREDEEHDEEDEEDLDADDLFDPDLIDVRLTILDRQGRHEEYLRLAEAAGQTTAYATMLVRLGRAGEAVEHSLQRLATAPAALEVARALREAGQLEPALRVAERGLTLEGRKVELATWTRDLASALGRTDRALAAGLIAFREDPSLAAYLRVQELAGPGWPGRKAELLDHLRRTRSFLASGPVDVFLHEGLVADAIAAVERDGNDSLVQRVMDAAVATDPAWVIRTGRKRAEPIMDGGKAQHYDAAVDWLRRAQEASKTAGRAAEWQRYLDDLIARHGRKYKLVPMLAALRKKM